MKKLLSPALSRWFCYTLVLLCSAMYAQPCTFEDVVRETTYDVPYKKYNAPLDMEKVLNAEKSNFLGLYPSIRILVIKSSEGNW